MPTRVFYTEARRPKSQAMKAQNETHQLAFKLAFNLVLGRPKYFAVSLYICSPNENFPPGILCFFL